MRISEILNESNVPELPRGCAAAAPVFVTFDYGCVPPCAGKLALAVTTGQACAVPVRMLGAAGYQFSVNGRIVHRGPEWTDDNCRIADRVTLELTAGKNELEVMLWNFGACAGLREMTAVAAFALIPDHPDWHNRLATGRAPWRACRLHGIQVVYPHMSASAAPRLAVDFNVAGEEWTPAYPISDSTSGLWMIRDRELPPQREARRGPGRLRTADTLARGAFHESIPEHLAAWGAALTAGKQVVFPPHGQWRFLWDCEDYVCAYGEISIAGGRSGAVEVLLTESLFEESEDWLQSYGHPVKGDRSQIEGKFVCGTGDRFVADGQAHICRSFDWDAGRYMLLRVQTGDEPLSLSKLSLTTTEYPLEFDARWQFAQAPHWDRLVGLCGRSLQGCMHTTYMDCPHYEQLMYAGDTRLEILSTYVSTRDRRLPRKALECFAASQTAGGFTLARYPSRERQLIPPFALFFVGMVFDYALWNDDPAAVGQWLTAARRVMAAFARCRESGGALLLAPAGWNFYDWSEGWVNGTPPGNPEQPGALLNAHYIYTLDMLAKLEDYVGSAEQAEVWRAEAHRMRRALIDRFFVPERGLLADDVEHRHFSQHTQVLALLGDCEYGTEMYRHLFEPDLSQCTVYFSHYLFEVVRKFRDGERFRKLLDFWFALPGKGLLTTPERPEPSRSDCHGWGAHPLYHLTTTLAGIYPAEFGGRQFSFDPLVVPDSPEFEVVIPVPDGALTVVRNGENWSVSCAGNVEVKNRKQIAAKELHGVLEK